MGVNIVARAKYYAASGKMQKKYSAWNFPSRCKWLTLNFQFMHQIFSLSKSIPISSVISSFLPDVRRWIRGFFACALIFCQKDKYFCCSKDTAQILQSPCILFVYRCLMFMVSGQLCSFCVTYLNRQRPTASITLLWLVITRLLFGLVVFSSWGQGNPKTWFSKMRKIGCVNCVTLRVKNKMFVSDVVSFMMFDNFSAEWMKAEV